MTDLAPFPAPTIYPEASLYPEVSPTYGLTNEQASVLAMSGTSGVPTVTQPNQVAGASSLIHNQFMAYMSQYTGGAVGPGNDPSQWSPEEAAAQTDRALARIGTANPELAQSLADARGKLQPEEDSGSFLGDLVDGIAHVAKVGVGGVLDLLDRSSHILPEVIHDWGKESAWKNVGDALSGDSDVRWHDVLRDSMGFGDSWMTAVAGFIGDVATDPLTYATFGLGGVAKSTAARLGVEIGTKGLVAEKVLAEGAEGGMSILDDMVRQGLEESLGRAATAEDAARVLIRGSESEMAQKSAGSVMQKVRSLLGKDISEDGWAHFSYSVGKDMEDGALKEALNGQMRMATQTANDIWNTITTRGWSRLTAKEASQMGIDKAFIDGQLKAVAKTGSGFFVGRQAYEEGKVANALLGGVRFKLPIPMLGMRLQSRNLIPLSQKFDFQVFRRFFAGLSGGERLASMLGKGANVEHMRAFWQGGFKGLKEFDEDVARKLASGSFLHGGSIMYPLSEQVGAITKHFSPHWKMYRGGGWGSKVIGDLNAQTTHVREQTKDLIEIVNDPRDPLKQLTPKEADALKLEGLGYKTNRFGYMVPPEDLEARNLEMDAYARTRAFGQRPDQTSEEFYRPLVTKAEQGGDLDLAAQLEQAQEAGTAAETAVFARGDKAKLQAQVDHGQVLNADEQLLRAGVYPDSVPDELPRADELRAPDAQRLRQSVNGEDVVHTPVDPTRFVAGLDPEYVVQDGIEGARVRGVVFKKGTRTIDEAAAAVPTPTPIDDSVEGVLRRSTESGEAMLKNTTRAGTKARADAEERLYRPMMDEVQAAQLDELNATIEAGTVVPAQEPGHLSGVAKTKEVESLNVEQRRIIAERLKARHYNGAHLDAPKQRAAVDRWAETGEWDAELLGQSRGAAIKNTLAAHDVRAFLDQVNAAGAVEVVGEHADVTAAREARQQLFRDARASAIPEPKGGGVVVVPKEFNGEYVIAPKNVYRPAEHTIDEFAENEAAAKKMLDEIERSKNAAVTEADFADSGIEAEMRKVIQDERERTLAQVNEQWLREHGFDAYETTVGEDTITVVLRDEGAANVRAARINPHAHWQGQATHGASRLLTEAAVNAVHRIAASANLPGGSRQWLEGLVRQSANMPFEEAEVFLRDQLGRVGVSLRPHQRVLDIDVFKASKYRTRKAAEDVVDMQMGASVKKLENMGFLDSPYRGGVPGGLPYRYVVNNGQLAAWEHYMGNLKEAESRAAEHQQRVDLPLMGQRADAMAEQLSFTRQQIETRKGSAVNEVNQARERAILGLVPPATAEPPAPARVPQLTTSSTEVETAMYRAQKEQMFAASADEDFAYHYGHAERLPEYRQSGLRASAPADVTPRGQKGVYFGSTGKRAWDLAPARTATGGPILMRVRRADHELISSDRIVGYESDEFFTRGNVSPDDIEYLGLDNEWHRLNAAEGEGQDLASREAQASSQWDQAMQADAQWLDEPDNRHQRAFDGLMRERAEAYVGDPNFKDHNPLPSGVRFERVSPDGAEMEIWRQTDDLHWESTGGVFDDTYGINTSGNGHWATKDGTPSTGEIRYFGVDPDGKVVALRQMVLKNPAGVGQAADPIHETLRRGSVGALTAPSVQGQGWGSALIDSHWDHAGIETWDDVESMIREQTYSTAGGNLNKAKIERMAKAQAKAAEEHVKQAKREFEIQNIERTANINEVNRMRAQARVPGTVPMPAVVPIENAKNMTGFQQVVVKGVGSMAMPSFMAQEFIRASEGFKSLTGFHKQWRQFNSWWKSMATWMWPGFHIRNFMGAWFNNWLGGVGVRDYITNARIRKAAREVEREGAEGYRWATQKVAVKDGDLINVLRKKGHVSINDVPLDEVTYADLAELQVGMGLTSANGRAFAEAELPAEKAARLGGKRSRIEKSRLPGWYAKGARGAGTMTENMFRGAAFVRGLRNYGELHEARLFTMLRHGDYADLTDFEFSTVRDVLPFYKWMRTNIPFQVHQLFESPGKLLAVRKGQEAVYDIQGRDFSADRWKEPDWMQSSFTIPVGKDETFNAVMLDLPMSDLFMGTREFASSFLPLARPIIESYLYEKSTFSGAPIEGKRVPLASAFNPVAGLLDTLGIAQKGEDGKAYISDKTQNLIGMVPAFSRFRNWLYEDPDRVKLRNGAMVSAMFGVGLRPVDEQSMASNELDYYYGQVLPAMEHLKQMGYPLPTTDDLENTYGTINTVLSKLGIEAGVAGSATTQGG